MKPIESTYQIIAWKHLDQNVDGKWSKWACDMMMVGFETEHLIELAGIEKPYNQFELKELTDKVFNELSLDYKNQDRVVTDYVTYLAEEVFNKKRDLLEALYEIKELCVELDYDARLGDFYSLYFAKDDLKRNTHQWYWEGADRNNIDKICMRHLRKWIIENEP